MNKYAVTRLARLSIIESFDAMDPTRSHELMPSQRIALKRSTRAAWKTVATTVAGAVGVLALLGRVL